MTIEERKKRNWDLYLLRRHKNTKQVYNMLIDIGFKNWDLINNHIISGRKKIKHNEFEIYIDDRNVLSR